MPRAYPRAATIHGKHVGFNLKKPKNGTYMLFYRGADDRRLKRDTQQSSIEQATKAALAILMEEHAPVTTAAETVSWDEAKRRIQEKAAARNLRAPTIEYYRKLIRRIFQFYPTTHGPVDISEKMAQSWKEQFQNALTRRKQPPSQHTVFSLIRGFSALWQNWFVEELGICASNPWRNVEPPKTDKLEVKIIDEDTFNHFLSWVDERYSGWELPRLFLETKAVTGCRLMDLCGTQSAQLQHGRLRFLADQTKGRKARSVPLPADLYARLEAIKGPTFLWESYPAGIKKAVASMGCPTHSIKSDFVPGRLYHWIETLFIDYGKEHPDKPPIHSHQLRKRAFTAAWKNNIDPRKAAIAYGCNVDTVMKHYVSMDEQDVTDEVVNQLADCLTPKK